MVKPELKLKVGILGATGMVGQRFALLLSEHPWFEVAVLAASERSAGKTYEEAVSGRWRMEAPIPEKFRKMSVFSVYDIESISSCVDFVFCAVSAGAEEVLGLEMAYAKAEIPVVSNNSAARWIDDVPMVIPEINSEHFSVINEQRRRLGTKRGFIAVKPNCSIQSYVPALAAWREFEPYECVVTTYQAISGAGKDFSDWPQMVGNIIPYICGEEKKSEEEPLKILGSVQDEGIVNAKELHISCQCLRVPVLNGHTTAVFVSFKKKPTREELIDKLITFRGFPQRESLPSAPKNFITYFEEDDRPQILSDVNLEEGMGISVGRLRKDKNFDYKFVGLSHNTIRGAAGGAVLCAETLVAMGYI